MGHRHHLWVRLTATLCVFIMMSMQAQPVLAAAALSVRQAAPSVAPNGPSHRAPGAKSAQVEATPPAKSIAPALSAAAQAPALTHARKRACEARKYVDFLSPGAGLGTPARPDPGGVMALPNAVTAADGGDAAFNRGLSRLFATSGEPNERLQLGPHNQYSDDECDEFESPVPPMMRQAHPVVEDVGAPYSGWAFADRETTLQFEDVKLIIPAGALVQDTRLTIRTIPGREAGALDEGMSNVVPGQRAFRLGPHGLFFQKPIKLILPYNHACFLRE